MKKIIIALTIIPSLVFAITDEQKDIFNKANIKVLEEKGLPTPGSGVQLVSQESMKMKSWEREKFSEENKELKIKGFIKRESNRAYELINIKSQIEKIQPQKDLVYKGTDSHLRRNVKDIPFAYSYIGAPKDMMIDFYGIAPVGTYVHEPKSGWTGAVEFFKTSFAHCAYTENNMVVSHGAAQIDEEEAKYDVNGKITLIDVEGNDSTGYLYRINWFDNTFNRNLECATKNYSTEVREYTIELAKKIDKNLTSDEIPWDFNIVV